MIKHRKKIQDVSELEDMLSSPTEEVVEQFSKLKGDILFLGVGGKIGPSLARMAKRACEQAGIRKRIIGVSRFSSIVSKDLLEKYDIETISGDLLDRNFLKDLPQVENVFFLAGMKFGSTENQPLTWVMNVYLPALVAEKYHDSKIVAYSTGNIYPYVSVKSGGCTEQDAPEPVGEYGQSTLGRERMFEYGSNKYGTQVAILRLSYAVEMRYGVIVDIARKVIKGQPIDLRNGHVNLIWQGDNNAMTLRSLDYCESPAKILNITGSEIISIRKIAEQFGTLFDKELKFENQESGKSLLADASLSHRIFGYPKVSIEEMVHWIADWIKNNQPLLDKPTHFETTDGKY